MVSFVAALADKSICIAHAAEDSNSTQCLGIAALAQMVLTEFGVNPFSLLIHQQTTRFFNLGRDRLNRSYINDPTQKRIDSLTIMWHRDTIEFKILDRELKAHDKK